MWVGKGDDWAHYTQYSPTFTPALTPPVAINGIWALPGASRRAPTGLAFATTLDHRLHLFADGAGTFHRIRAH